MNNLKKKACKVLSVALSIMMTATAFTGFSTTSVNAATVADQSGNYVYTDLEDGTIEITKCVVNGSVDIPSEIDGKKVTSIGKYAFADGITSVSIPESVVTIQDNAFYNCYSLEKINFSEGLKYIGKDAFYSCSLQKLNLPETLEEIDDYAFSGNYNISEINLPKTRGVKLGNYTFDRGTWYWSQPDGPIVSGKTFLCYKSYQVYLDEYTIPYGIESIGSSAFTDLNGTTTIDIPDTVKYISEGAFRWTEITEVVIPDGVEAIEDDTFQGCWNLEKVALPDTVTYIGDNAFENCEKLSSLSIPEKVTYIGDYAFAYSGISEFVLPEDNKLTNFGANALYYTPWYNTQPDGPIYIDDIFVGMKLSEGTIIQNVDIKDGTKLVAGKALCEFTGNISVPDSVKHINNYAFANTSITQDDIPANVETIGQNAFENCLNITELTLPQSLKTIDDYAFLNCNNLANVSESDNLISIGDYAFSSTQIKTFPIGSGLKNFGTNVFEYNEVLEAFTVDTGNKYFSAKDGVLYNKDQNIMICYPPAKKETKLVITDDIFDFKDAFSSGNAYITEIEIEEGIQTIPSYAFNRLPNVEVITIPTTVTKIGEYLFDYECNLQTVNYNAVDCNAKYAFNNLYNLTTINFGSEVKTVSDSMFASCSSLENINFNGSIEFIYPYAFAYTPWHENIQACDDGEIVYVDKVAYCSNNPTGSVEIKDGTKSIYADAFSYSGNLTSITIPDSVEYIGDNAFDNCYNLKNIEMSSNVEYIGNNAFMNCSNFTEIDLGNNLTYLGSYAFSYCSSLESITIPSGVDAILYDTFQSCSALKSVTLNEGINRIDGYAFAYTGSLESIKLPSTVEKIDYEAFCQSGISSIELNEGLKSIENYAFEHCEKLESIVCPSTLKTIGYNAFYGCYALNSVLLNEGLETLDDGAFEYCSALESIEIPSSVKTIGYEAFEYCTSLNTVTLNEGLECIEAYAFYTCEALENIVIPSTVKTIDYDAFGNCTSLNNVTLNEGLEHLGNSAFYSTAIKSIEIPTTVTYINFGVFNNCTNLYSVTLHEGITGINSGAFQNCSSLTDILIPSTVNYIDENVFNQNVNIHGYTGSYAQAYVEYHWYDEDLTHTFVAIERTMGDINCDGIVNITDATDLQKYLADMITLTDKQLACADVTGNGKIDIKDVTEITMALAGMFEL